MARRLLAACLLLVFLPSCHPARRPAHAPPARTVTVTAFAYNSTPAQTDSRPHQTASGQQLRPGRKAIAVSRDLEEMGLTFGTVVRIDGLDGEWTVLDRMGTGKRRSIDIYMGEDVGAARRWGRREVTISWTTQDGKK